MTATQVKKENEWAAATDKQVALIDKLVKQAGHPRLYNAMKAAGFSTSMAGRGITGRKRASEIIDALMELKEQT